jgi:hypothetical protein
MELVVKRLWRQRNKEVESISIKTTKSYSYYIIFILPFVYCIFTHLRFFTSVIACIYCIITPSITRIKAHIVRICISIPNALVQGLP